MNTTVFDIRVEIENVGDFKEIESALKEKFKGRKIYEISLVNVD